MRAIVALVVALSCAAFAPAQGLASSTPGLNVPASYLVTGDGQVIWKHNSSTERRVASTIKMLNALVVMDHVTDFDKVVSVPAKAGRTPGVGLVTGQRLTLRELLQLMLVASANDAAETLSIRIAGNEKAYVKLMNAKAKELGLKHTHAIDPHGLSKREHSTAADLSVLARNVMADPLLAATVRKQTVSFTPVGKPTRRAHTTDALLGKYDGLVGVKTGFTNPAGYCFVGDAKRGEVTLVSVVLGARAESGRFTQTRKLLDWGFSGFKRRTLISTTTTIGAVSVIGGVESSVTVHPSREATAMAWTRSPMTRRLVLPASVRAPVARGAQLGVVQVMQNGHALVSIALLADNDVAALPPTPTPTPTASAAEGAGVASDSIWRRLGGFTSRVWTAMLSGLRIQGSAAASTL